MENTNTLQAVDTAAAALDSIDATANAMPPVQSAIAKLSTDYRLITLSLSQVRARVKDSVAASLVERDAHAEEGQDAFSVYKALFPGRSGAELRKVTKIFGSIRRHVYAQTLPFSMAGDGQRKRGPRLIHNNRLGGLIAEIDSMIAEGNAAAGAFAQDYASHVSAASRILGDAFDAGQYPPGEVFRAGFSAVYGLSEVPTGSGAPAMLPGDIAERLQEQAQAGQELALRNAITALQKQSLEAISKMAKNLADVENTRLHASVVRDVRQALDALTSNNWTNDPRIDRLANAIQQHLLALDTKQLKANPAAAADVANKAAKIGAALEKMDFCDVF